MQFSPEAGETIVLCWPGNVRELENVVQRAIVLTRQVIQPQYLVTSLCASRVFLAAACRPVAAQTAPAVNFEKTDGLQDAMEATTPHYCRNHRTSPTRQAAATAPGISERTLRYKLARMRERGMELPRRRSAQENSMIESVYKPKSVR